jgi:two-component system CheB/CheR fusion protein
LAYLRQTRSFDFGAYKRSSLERRIQKRLLSVGLGNFSDYIDYLEVHPEEFAVLFNTILINVTDFFRDPPAWEVVRESVIPRIVAGKSPDEHVRVWSAGCASGQEAYSAAILLAEALGEPAFRSRVKVYATDVDESALNEARQAIYTDQQIQSVPEPLREKYFDRVNNRYSFRKDLRRSIIFGRHDLLADAPISRVDLLICRNTLMYFNAEAQTQVLSRFDFALNGSGYLFLGKAEMLLTRSAAFVPLDIKHRLFSKSGKHQLHDRPNLAPSVDGELPPLGADGHLRELALEVDPVAQVVFDLDGNLAVVNAQARLLFNLHPLDLEAKRMEPRLFRPLDLRSAIEQVIRECRVIQLNDVEWTAGAEQHYLDITVYPLTDATNRPVGVKLLFTDVTRLWRLQTELQTSHQALETANEELQSSNEELETTNEELQSTVEELETTNEELQSTNEELETMNEELQSTNEEVETVNTQLRQRGEELDRLNAFLESIMAGLRDGVVVLDNNLLVRAWNETSENLWGLRAAEVRGQHFLGLDIGLPVEHLRPIIRASLSGETGTAQMVDLQAVNRRGKNVRLQINATRLVDDKQVVQGVILVMRELEPDGRDGNT